MNKKIIFWKFDNKNIINNVETNPSLNDNWNAPWGTWKKEGGYKII